MGYNCSLKVKGDDLKPYAVVVPEDLVGVAEAAEILGVGRQQVHRLSRRNDFPEPLAELKSGKIWRRADVERWAMEHADRRPGRPPAAR